MDARHQVRDLLWLALAVTLAYANALVGVFQFDDFNVIVFNPAVHGSDSWNLQSGLAIRPLLKASYTLDWAGESSTLRYHAMNIVIHLAQTGVVWALARAWLRAQGLTSNLPTAAVRHVPRWTALLFALHPANTEAVTYICGRSSSMMALFYGLAMLAYALGREARPPWQRRWLLGCAVPLLMALAMAVKETALTLPMSLLLWEWACGGTLRQAWRRQWPVWMLALCAVVFFLGSTSYLTHLERSVRLNSLQGNLATQATALRWLLMQWLLPLWPNIDPDLPLRHHWREGGIDLLLMAGLLILAASSWRTQRTLSFALVWLLLHLVPVYLFFPRLDIANERQLYLAAWPLALALALHLAGPTDRGSLRARVACMSIAIFLIAEISLTVVRNHDYRSEIALWEQTVRVSPGKARAHNNLGYAYMLAGRDDEAREQFRTALAINPELVKARMNLMRLEGRLEGRLDE